MKTNLRRYIHKMVSNKPRFIVNPIDAVKKRNITVLGGGAWGTALAIIASRKNNVRLWTRTQDQCNKIIADQQNKRYLPDVILPKKLLSNITSNIELAANCKILLLAVPTQTVRENLNKIKDFINKETTIVICCKGIELDSLKLISQVVHEILPDNMVAVLSGPNFAMEAAKGLPCAATLSCRDDFIAQKVISALSYENFRVYYSEDIISSQVSGAVKNVIAIASGVCMGKGYGENARAALITRGLAEILRLTEVHDGNLHGIIGLSGVGDLMLTANSAESRNKKFGLLLAKDINIEEAKKQSKGVIEGIPTSLSINKLCEKHDIEMPISQAVYSVLYENADVDKTIKDLLRRPIKI